MREYKITLTAGSPDGEETPQPRVLFLTTGIRFNIKPNHMKILWITNSPLPEAYEMLKLKAPVTVGWVNSAANALLARSEKIKLAVASFYPGRELKELTSERMVHYLLPEILKTKPNDATNDHLWHSVNAKFKPDLVHIHGSEYPHSYSYVRACGAERVVVSIQGLVSIYERYYYGDIEKTDLLKSTTLRDLIRFDTLFSQRKNMQRRGDFEKLLIGKVNHFIGRTSWDRDHIWAINPTAAYHFCNETLRPSFYKKQWSLKNCEPYSIFVSQAHYPIKGFHQLVKALPIILGHFPSAKVYVAGNNFFSNRGMRINGFGHYINSLIDKYKLSGKILFTGLLNEEEMCQRFLSSHVFVCPSAIENSPNSVGEAQLLGVPCIASFVGGTADLVEHGKTGLLYRFEEVEMLASNVCRVFSDDNFASEISGNEKAVAAARHNQINNAERLYQIYTNIVGQEKTGSTAKVGQVASTINPGFEF